MMIGIVLGLLLVVAIENWQYRCSERKRHEHSLEVLRALQMQQNGEEHPTIKITGVSLGFEDGTSVPLFRSEPEAE